MQLVANQQLVRNRARLGLGFHLTAMVVFVVGFVLSTQLEPSGELPWQSWAAIIVGLVLYSLGQTQLRRWGPSIRQDEQVGQAIRSLDDRYKVYAFLSSSLPDYILVSPAGVQVLVIRQEGGQVTCVRDRWKSRDSLLTAFFRPTLGNPSTDAAKQVQKLRALLAEEHLEDVPTSSLIVFTNAKAQLRIEGCSSTVTRIKELKDVLRRMAGKGTSVALSTARIKEIQKVLDQRMQAARSWR